MDPNQIKASSRDHATGVPEAQRVVDAPPANGLRNLISRLSASDSMYPGQKLALGIAAGSEHEPKPQRHLQLERQETGACNPIVSPHALVSSDSDRARGGNSTPRVRKPYTKTNGRQVWTAEEHERFLAALKLYGREWKKIQDYVETKTVPQIMSHAQKHFLKVQKKDVDGFVPPPRPKRKSTKPYPRKADSDIKESGPSQAGSSVSRPQQPAAQGPAMTMTTAGVFTSWHSDPYPVADSSMAFGSVPFPFEVSAHNYQSFYRTNNQPLFVSNPSRLVGELRPGGQIPLTVGPEAANLRFTNEQVASVKAEIVHAAAVRAASACMPTSYETKSVKGALSEGGAPGQQMPTARFSAPPIIKSQYSHTGISPWSEHTLLKYGYLKTHAGGSQQQQQRHQQQGPLSVAYDNMGNMGLGYSTNLHSDFPPEEARSHSLAQNLGGATSTQMDGTLWGARYHDMLAAPLQPVPPLHLLHHLQGPMDELQHERQLQQMQLMQHIQAMQRPVATSSGLHGGASLQFDMSMPFVPVAYPQSASWMARSGPNQFELCSLRNSASSASMAVSGVDELGASERSGSGSDLENMSGGKESGTGSGSGSESPAIRSGSRSVFRSESQEAHVQISAPAKRDSPANKTSGRSKEIRSPSLDNGSGSDRPSSNSRGRHSGDGSGHGSDLPSSTDENGGSGRIPQLVGPHKQEEGAINTASVSLQKEHPVTTNNSACGSASGSRSEGQEDSSLEGIGGSDSSLTQRRVNHAVTETKHIGHTKRERERERKRSSSPSVLHKWLSHQEPDQSKDTLASSPKRSRHYTMLTRTASTALRALGVGRGRGLCTDSAQRLGMSKKGRDIDEGIKSITPAKVAKQVACLSLSVAIGYLLRERYKEFDKVSTKW
ncbi:Protein REVEILLE 8 [Porphyridium purpureum]|uniref:Protein REVEILLE 8 n=1 Tax=Porphyridium purpureum TaxID=35688 RepID=A0A5J4Z672_PORPP|nr:Protein REVEILLE 8 [Porphyridium purpureum]|eukprot:POR0056..scf295_1